MAKKVICIKDFSVDKCDDNGFTIENEYFEVSQDSIWEIAEVASRIAGGEVRLTNKSRWLEIDKESFEEYFDGIICLPKLQMIEDIEHDLKECIKCLKESIEENGEIDDVWLSKLEEKYLQEEV